MRSSPLELLLELLIESEMLADEAEPALDAEEAKLSAWTGTAAKTEAAAMATAHMARV